MALKVFCAPVMVSSKRFRIPPGIFDTFSSTWGAGGEFEAGLGA
eukprot:CAMPEP_0181401204 /NCGR_PEP_ID=MMETSP1110-20121109/2526_1 /TAXON_ID=174948 /ORGANISM="Symbiodinium sp., Strain CCMP421" /LENGTH=43 /DNA_ID= /DNA_START= /DNA_END= /DNA_ORIENTATION=